MFAFALMFLLVIGGTITFVIVGNARSKSLAHINAERRLLAAPADFVDGAHVRVEGTVEPIQLLVAPASQLPCVAIRLRAQTGKYWRVTTEMNEFVLRTAHGPLVVPHTVYFELAMRPLRRRTVLLPNHLLYGDGRQGNSAACEETLVTPGMRVWVAGIVATEPAPPTSELGFRDTNKIVRIVARREHPLTIGELP